MQTTEQASEESRLNVSSRLWMIEALKMVITYLKLSVFCSSLTFRRFYSSLH
ncbi:hypothetical protein HOLleu_39689 [Holothuria leucospilota]|uniref:Uncharacterized protein n=1 Tax=Holothuria leucospilota TaxID=206669 RepID=A0A9Q0YEA9_HOLLE|nr:hypothetical protein HOLleu_39689 [Holothuria leucospilota]